jgi:hypothetical protein
MQRRVGDFHDDKAVYITRMVGDGKIQLLQKSSKMYMLAAHVSL